MKIQPHPLDRPGIVKILLGREASEALAASGEHHFALITKPDSTCPPGSDGRLVLLALPLGLETARAAESVALGRARAARIKTPRAAPTPTTDAAADSEQSSRDYGASRGAESRVDSDPAKDRAGWWLQLHEKTRSLKP